MSEKGTKSWVRGSVSLAALCVVLATQGVEAGVIPSNLEVDFRGKEWSAANNKHSYSVGSVTVTANPGSKLLWQDSIDGLGIRGGTQSDEIELYELLEVKFEGGKALSGVWVTDLFSAPDAVIGEKGVIVINGGEKIIAFDGNDADQANGELYVDFGGNIVVYKAEFYADYVPGINPADNEYSVAGFAGVVSDPIVATEPGTLGLLAMGSLALLALGARRRRAARFA
jgi:hypothetical protein